MSDAEAAAAGAGAQPVSEHQQQPSTPQPTLVDQLERFNIIPAFFDGVRRTKMRVAVVVVLKGSR